MTGPVVYTEVTTVHIMCAFVTYVTPIFAPSRDRVTGVTRNRTGASASGHSKPLFASWVATHSISSATQRIVWLSIITSARAQHTLHRAFADNASMRQPQRIIHTELATTDDRFATAEKKKRLHDRL